MLLQMGGQLQAGRRAQAAEPALEWHNGFWQPPKDRQSHRQPHYSHSPPEPPHPSVLHAPYDRHPAARDSHSGHKHDRQHHAANRQQEVSYDRPKSGRRASQDQQFHAGPGPGRYEAQDEPGRRQAGYNQGNLRGRDDMTEARDEGNRRPAGYNQGDLHERDDLGYKRQGAAAEEAGARALADRGEAARMTAAALQKLNYRSVLP